MATKLFLRSTANNGIGTFYDMGTTAGSASTTGVVDTVASGTEIQWTRTAGGTVLEWISGRVPAGGFTLSGTMTFSIWANESHMNANCGARARVFKWTAAGVESEIGGGPYNDGVEFGTAAAEMTWTGTPTSTAFSEDDRIVVRYYITNVGTMGGGFTCTLTYNAADAATGDSFFQINENVAFKTEDQTLTPGPFTNSQTFHAATVSATYGLSPSLFTNSQTFYAPAVSASNTLTPGLLSNGQTFYAATVAPGPVSLSPSLFTNGQTFHAATVGATYALTPALHTNTQTFYGPTVSAVAADQTLAPSPLTNTQTIYAPTLAASNAIQIPLLAGAQSFYAASIIQDAVLTPPLLGSAILFFSPSTLPPPTYWRPGSDRRPKYYHIRRSGRI